MREFVLGFGLIGFRVDNKYRFSMDNGFEGMGLTNGFG